MSAKIWQFLKHMARHAGSQPKRMEEIRIDGTTYVHTYDSIMYRSKENFLFDFMAASFYRTLYLLKKHVTY